MKEIVLLKVGEIVLKGLNRRNFEDRLIKNIKATLRDLGEFQISCAQSAIYVIPLGADIDLDEVIERLRKIFGVVALSRCCVCPKDITQMKTLAQKYLADTLEDAATFKVEAKRSDKRFPLNSPQISAELGGHLLQSFPNLRVDVHNPDVTVIAEVRETHAYIHGEKIRGAGGIPVGTGGNGAILISGGIDSPVAAWMMAKRGMSLTAIHFASPPYTSERAEQKVVSLLKKVALYSGEMTMFTVPFTKIQESIKDACPEELFTIIMRRCMMKISEEIARNQGCDALITGESLGQVASQTIKALVCTDAATSLPVLRPLIGMDKDEIVAISRRIDTFDISIQPYEDCCTVFTPKHPRTRPTLKVVSQAEGRWDLQALMQEALENLKVTKIEWEG